MTQGTLFPNLVSKTERFRYRRTDEITFKGKLTLPIHRWYRLTPSFSPRLAFDIAECFGIKPNAFVLDPFSGVGTVPLCMKYRGIPSCAVELNPYLHFVSTVKTRTYREVDTIKQLFEDAIRRSRDATKGLNGTRCAERFLLDNECFIPPIYKPERWWSTCNLAQLVAIRRELLDMPSDSDAVNLLRMGVLAILVQVSNARHSHVSLTFAKEPLQTVDVVYALERKLIQIVDDLSAVSDFPCADVMVHLGNSKYMSKTLSRSPGVSHVITSPPYPNRFSYARETRPHLFFFSFIQNAKTVGQLETDAIGGTWGKATSVLANGVEPANDLVADLLAPHLQAAPEHGGLMANYVIKYFNDIFVHTKEIAKVCREQARLAYVIGNSKFYGNPLPSDELLAAIFAHHGFRLDGIHKMRRRQSKSGLYEAVVLMSR